MEIVQVRMVTDEVAQAAAFYAELLGVEVVLNDYYVEVPAGAVTIGFSKTRFAEYDRTCLDGAVRPPTPTSTQVILDLEVDDIDAEFHHVASLGVDWLLCPTTQPWGHRSMMFRGPSGVAVNISSRQSDYYACEKRTR